MGLWKRIKSLLITVVIVALAVAAGYLYCFPRKSGEIRRTVDPPALVQQIQQLKELATVRYTIQKVIGLEEEKIPFGSEALLMVVQATVQGGIDLTELKPQDLQVAADRSVTIRLPAARILEVSVNDKQTKVWQRTKTWWTPWVDFNPEMEQQARLAAREYVQTAALQMGILTNAQRNAETTIREFLVGVGIPAVRFSARPSSP